MYYKPRLMWILARMSRAENGPVEFKRITCVSRLQPYSRSLSFCGVWDSHGVPSTTTSTGLANVALVTEPGTDYRQPGPKNSVGCKSSFPFPPSFVSDIAIFVLKRDVKHQLTN